MGQKTKSGDIEKWDQTDSPEISDREGGWGDIRIAGLTSAGIVISGNYTHTNYNNVPH